MLSYPAYASDTSSANTWFPNQNFTGPLGATWINNGAPAGMRNMLCSVDSPSFMRDVIKFASVCSSPASNKRGSLVFNLIVAEASNYCHNSSSAMLNATASNTDRHFPAGTKTV